MLGIFGISGMKYLLFVTICDDMSTADSISAQI